MKVYYQKHYGAYSLLKNIYKIYDFKLFRIKIKQQPIDGKNNKFYTIKNGEKIQIDTIPVNNISIEGNNNIIFIHDISSFKNNCIQILGDNNCIEIKKPKVPIQGMNIWFRAKAHNRKLEIGENTIIGNGEITVYKDDMSVSIGDNCLFSSKWEIRTNDGHDIYDLKTNEIINNSKSVFIGNNVWVGAKTTFLKGAVIPNGCIIGINSIINKKFTKKNCIIAGIPARIVKENVYWKM